MKKVWKQMLGGTLAAVLGIGMLPADVHAEGADGQTGLPAPVLYASFDNQTDLPTITRKALS